MGYPLKAMASECLLACGSAPRTCGRRRLLNVVAVERARQNPRRPYSTYFTIPALVRLR